jgi:serine/threonine-protein kinase
MLLSLPPRPASRPRLIPGLSLRAGDLVAGRFRTLSLLSADRACAHLAAVQVGTNARVHVQILIAMEDAIESVHLRFLADARKAMLLQGPNIDRVLHVGVTEDGHPFVVREPEADQTLATVLAEMGSLPTEGAVDVAIAVCKALEAAHAHGLVHTELDTNAVRLVWTPSGPSKVKVMGLGTSRALGTLSLEGRSLSALAIHAPERLSSDRELDALADIWGVGVLLHTMLAGSPPFTAEAPATVNVSAALDEPALLAGVPDGLADLVDACLSRNPVLRPQSAGALAANLAGFGTQQPSLPVFEKRSSLLVVDTGPYDALVLERLTKEAAPGSSEQAIDVEFSVPDLSRLANEQTPEPVVVTASVPPVAFSIAAPLPVIPRRAPAPTGNKRRTTMMVAAACIAMGMLAIGAVTMRASASRPSASSIATSAAEAPPPAVDLPHAAALAKVEAATTPATPDVATLGVNELPSIAKGPRARAMAPRPAGAKARASEPAAAPAPAAPAAPAPAVDPIVPSAAAPVQPQPKASDDDLRRFLDDRR